MVFALIIGFNLSPVPLEPIEPVYTARPLPPQNLALPESLVTMPKERLGEEEEPLGMRVIPGVTSGIWRAVQDTGRQMVPQDIGINFEGISFTYYVPPDVQLAVGPSYAVEMVNSHIAIYRKSDGAQVYFNDFYTFTGIANQGTNSLYDPRIAYDIQAGRWIITIDHTDWNNQMSQIVLMVSANSDPLSGFTRYDINAEVPAGTWADYPMLGFNSWGIFISSNQFTWAGAYSRCRLLILDKASAYSGGPLTGSQISDANAFSWRVTQSMEPCNTAFLVMSYSGWANVIEAWKITGSAASPVISPQFSVSVNFYSAPPQARQPGPNDNIDAGDARLQDATYKAGKIFLTLGEAHDWGSGNSCAARYIRIDTATMTADRDITYGADGIDYYYPRVAPDDNCANMIFTRSSDTEYASVYVTTKQLVDASFAPSSLIKAGEDTYVLLAGGRNRWGDYSGGYMDPAGNCVWAAAEYAKPYVNPYDRWGTWIVRFSCGPLYAEIGEEEPHPVRLPAGGVFLGQVVLDLNARGSFPVYNILGQEVARLQGPGRARFAPEAGVYWLKVDERTYRFVVVQ